MTQRFAHQKKVLLLPQQVRGEGMPEGMDMDIFINPCLFPQPFHQPSEPPATQGFLAVKGCEYRTITGRSTGRFNLKPGLECGPGGSIEPQAPVFPALTLADPQAPGGQVNIPMPQVDEFGRPEPGIQEQPENGLFSNTGRLRQKPGLFFQG
jgi:hypothetical protein